MTKRSILTLALSLGIVLTAAYGASAVAGDAGIIRVASANSVKATADKMAKILKKNGATVFARINHAAGANKVGKELRPTELLVFGNPKLGTPLMMQNQQMGLDLPLKALIYKAKDRKTYIAYNDPAYLSKRHGVDKPEKVLKKMAGVLKNVTAAAGKK